MRTFLLNLTTRPDRLADATEELRRAEIPFTLSQRDQDPRGGKIGAKHHVADLPEAANGDDVWIMEDDVVLHRDFTEIYHALQVPSDWELFYLGGALRIDRDGKAYAERVAPGIVRTFSTLQTHCVMIRGHVAAALPAILRASDAHWDVDLLTTIQPNGRSYQCHPVLARQRPSRSDIQAVDLQPFDFYVVDGENNVWPR